VVWHHSLLLMNSFNKTEAAVFSCKLCFLRAFLFISLLSLQYGYTVYEISLSGHGLFFIQQCILCVFLKTLITNYICNIIGQLTCLHNPVTNQQSSLSVKRQWNDFTTNSPHKKCGLVGGQTNDPLFGRAPTDQFICLPYFTD